jgi:hypothetical protein
MNDFKARMGDVATGADVLVRKETPRQASK